MNEVEFKGFSELLKFVLENPHSDFYRKKYQNAGFNSLEDFKNPVDVAKIPFLTKKELSETNPEERFYYPFDSLWQVFSTSGSSFEKPAIIYRRQSRRQIDRNNRKNAKKLLFLYSPSRVRVFNVESAVVLLVGDLSNLEATAYQAAMMNVDSIYSYPSLLINFSSILAKYFDLTNIKFILCGGEMMTESKINLLRSLFPSATIESRYSSVEAGLIGYSCSDANAKPNTYHLYSNVYAEKLGEGGELVISHLNRYANFGTPLIRYKLGDSIEFFSGGCSCLRKGKLFRVIGRLNQDFIKVGGGMILASNLEDVLKDIKGVKDFLLHVTEVLKQDKLLPSLLLEIVADGKSEVSSFIVKEILNSRLKVGARTFLGEAVDKGYFLPLEIRITDEIKRSGHKKTYISNSF